MIQKVKVINYNPEEIQEKIDALKQEIKEHNAPIKKYNKKVAAISICLAISIVLVGFILMGLNRFCNQVKTNNTKHHASGKTQQ